MKRILVTMLVLLASGIVYATQRKGATPLKGWVVILDAGHGGEDPGAHDVFQGKRVYEDEYVFDVALRARRIIKSMGGIALMTTQDFDRERNSLAAEIFPHDTTETYTGTTRRVRAGTRGLRYRLQFGNQQVRRYPNHKFAWISIHFDVVGKKDEIEGVRIIAAPTGMRLANALYGKFDELDWTRKHGPVAVNGDPRYGLKNLFILNGENKIGQKVLIELGNFLNEEDLWRVRNWNSREKYAQAIANAIKRF